MGDYMEDTKAINKMGYEIGSKIKLHDFEVLKLLEFFKYEQYHELLRNIISIAKEQQISLPDKLLNYNIETFETYMHALWEGFMKSCSNFKEEVC